MSLAIVHTRCIHGTEALAVQVEAHIANGLPTFTIVGLPEAAVRESRDRVRSALVNSGFEFPQRRLTVNLAPGDVPKEGTRFDLAIAIGILAASGQVPASELEGIEFLAELALDGTLRPARASLAAAIASARAGRALVVATADGENAALVAGACIHPATNLGQVVRHLCAVEKLEPTRPAVPPATATGPDLADVLGQPRARRALEVAAAGGHNLLLVGPPGTGKSMLAQRLPGLLPPLALDEALDAAALRSIAGLAIDASQWRLRPFRAPHHSASAVALVGGGRLPRPGEISLAHRGVLFLDELPEFDRNALEALREPLETGAITIARAQGTLTFPAMLQLIAAMNPCPCGYHGDPRIECRCTPAQVARYRARISGPLAERIDMHVEVARENPALLAAAQPTAESSASVSARVARCRAVQQSRQEGLNAQLDAAGLRRWCRTAPDATALLVRAAERLALSARSQHKVLKLARTIADLAGAMDIGSEHLAEAIGYRVFDRGNATR
ncbi:MAG: YifB family Mg chelatase-like AAA ATPase [Gammaproteobacteria bacterium]